MMYGIRNRITFYMERIILRGASFRLLFIALVIGLVSVIAGAIVRSSGTDFLSTREAVWWAFLRLTDPGYLGDDKGALVRTVSTVLTILGYVLFMGSLIAIMTQWLNQTIATLEKGLTPILQRNHVLILGWSNRTPIIVHELMLSVGRVRRFLQRHRAQKRRFLRRSSARRLRIVILSERVDAELRYELREYLKNQWRERQIVFRSGTPLRIEHLRRVDFMKAAAIILPGSDFTGGGSESADMRTIKTLLSISNHGSREKGGDLPLLVAEIFDARQIPAAKAAYGGRLEILASDSVISLLIAQNVRHQRLSHVYSELLTHGKGNGIFVRNVPAFQGAPVQSLMDAFPRAVVLGALRREGSGYTPMLNPACDLALEPGDLVALMARTYEDSQPVPGFLPAPVPQGVARGHAPVSPDRRILVMGWSDKIPALIHEFDSYQNESFHIDILSAVPRSQREQKMARYEALHPQRVKLQHLEGDYCSLSHLVRVDPAKYDNIVLMASDWLESKEQADARTVVGYLLLRQVLEGVPRQPAVLLELYDPENQALFQGEDEVLISPMILSHILAHVALRPELNVVFNELFSSGGAEIFFRPVDHYAPLHHDIRFRDLQQSVLAHGDTALGIRLHAGAGSEEERIQLNPPREETWAFEPGDEVVVLTTCD